MVLDTDRSRALHEPFAIRLPPYLLHAPIVGYGASLLCAPPHRAGISALE